MLNLGSSAGRGFIVTLGTLPFAEDTFKSLEILHQTLLGDWDGGFGVSWPNLLFLNLRDSFLLPELLRALWLFLFLRRNGWDGAGFCCSSLHLALGIHSWFFESICFFKGSWQGKVYFFKREVSHVTSPFPESLCGTRNGLMKVL